MIDFGERKWDSLDSSSDVSAIPIEATFFLFSLSRHERPKGRIESSKPTRSGYPRFVLLHALPRGGRKEKGVEGSSKRTTTTSRGLKRRATPVAASTETERRGT